MRKNFSHLKTFQPKMRSPHLFQRFKQHQKQRTLTLSVWKRHSKFKCSVTRNPLSNHPKAEIQNVWIHIKIQKGQWASKESISWHKRHVIDKRQRSEARVQIFKFQRFFFSIIQWFIPKQNPIQIPMEVYNHYKKKLREIHSGIQLTISNSPSE